MSILVDYFILADEIFMQIQLPQPEPISGPHLIVHVDRRKLRARAGSLGILPIIWAVIQAVYLPYSLQNRDLLDSAIAIPLTFMLLLSAWQIWRCLRLSSKREPVLVINYSGILLKHIAGRRLLALPWSEIESISVREFFSEKSLCIRRRMLHGMPIPFFRPKTLNIPQAFLDSAVDEIFLTLIQTYASELNSYNVQTQS